jgi:hypothetical protein
MRWFSQLIVNLILIAEPVQALDVSGIVVDRSGAPISGAVVKLVGIGSDTTTQTGEFRIPIPDSRVGQRVNIVIAKDGWALASDQPLAFIVPADPVSDALRITLSKALTFGASAEIDQPTVNFSVVSESPEDDFTVAYSADRVGDKLRITPELPYLDLFKRGGPIAPDDYWLTPFEMTLPQLDITVTNNTNKTVFFNEAVFDIESSQLDPSPLLVIPERDYGGMKMSFINFGWKKLTDVTIKCNLVRAKETEDFTRLEETLNVTTDENGSFLADFSDVLARLGVDVATLRNPYEEATYSASGETYKIRTKNGRTVVLSGSEYKQRMLKAYGPFPEEMAKVVGEISYADPVDTSKRQSVRFLGLLYFQVQVQPLGGRAPPTCEYAVKFDVDNQHYERHISLAQALKPQDFDHFTIRVAADKSSIHRFKLRLLYNNGLVIESPPVELNLFMPRATELSGASD